MNWWYPQQLPVTNNTQIDNSTIANTNVESNTDIKVESIDDIEDCLDLGEDMDLEDVEIMPDPGHENEDNDGDDDGGDDDLNDPNYDPNEDEATTSKRYIIKINDGTFIKYGMQAPSDRNSYFKMFGLFCL